MCWAMLTSTCVRQKSMTRSCTAPAFFPHHLLSTFNHNPLGGLRFSCVREADPLSAGKWFFRCAMGVEGKGSRWQPETLLIKLSSEGKGSRWQPETVLINLLADFGRRAVNGSASTHSFDDLPSTSEGKGLRLRPETFSISSPVDFGPCACNGSDSTHSFDE